MATVETYESERPVVGWPPLRMSWGAIFGGAVAALGIWLLLWTLGLALGLSSVEPAAPGSVRGAGLFTGIWSLISPLVALFVGGMVAARGAGVINKAGGALHGLVMWGLTAIIGAYLLATLLGNIVGGIASAGRSAMGAAAGATGQGQVQGIARSFGLDAEDALGPINERLRAEGKPEITAEQFQAATRDVISDATRQGRLDRELLITSISEQTALSRQDAEEVATRVEQQFGGIKEQAQAGALKAADTTGKVFWGVFGALFLGLISAILGAVSGVSKRQRAYAESGVIVPGEEGVRIRREVHP